MCSVGGGDFSLDIEEMDVVEYKCRACGNIFRGMGEELVCPSCQSENVARFG